MNSTDPINEARQIYRYIRVRKGSQYLTDLVNSFEEDAPSILNYLRCLVAGKIENGTHERVWCIVDASDEYEGFRRLVSTFETYELASAAFEALHDDEGFPINPEHGTYELDNCYF